MPRQCEYTVLLTILQLQCRSRGLYKVQQYSVARAKFHEQNQLECMHALGRKDTLRQTYARLVHLSHGTNIDAVVLGVQHEAEGYFDKRGAAAEHYILHSNTKGRSDSDVERLQNAPRTAEQGGKGPNPLCFALRTFRRRLITQINGMENSSAVPTAAGSVCRSREYTSPIAGRTGAYVFAESSTLSIFGISPGHGIELSDLRYQSVRIF